GDAVGHRDGTSQRDLGCCRGCSAPAGQLVPAREVLRRRRVGLRGEPGRLRDAAPLGRHALHPGRSVLVPRRGDQQLHVEPALDVPAPARPHRLPGAALPRGLDHRPRHALELRREQALELPTAARRLALLLALAALVAPSAASADPKAPVYDSHGDLIGTPFVPQDEPAPAELTDKEAIAAVLAYPKVADWVDRYPAEGLTKQATLDEDAGSWSVKVWSDLPDAGQIVDAKVDDETGKVTEAWTGPQVAWKMA